MASIMGLVDAQIAVSVAAVADWEIPAIVAILGIQPPLSPESISTSTGSCGGETN